MVRSIVDHVYNTGAYQVAAQGFGSIGVLP